MSSLLLNWGGKCRLILILLLSTFLSTNIAVSQPNGEQLFKSKCSSCHYITGKKLIGPGLAGVNDKYEQDWLIEWIRNNVEFQQVNAQAKQVFEENGGLAMNTFPELKDEDILAILDYVANPPVEEQAATAAAGGEGGAAEEDDGTFTSLILLGVIVLLVIITSLLRNVRFSLEKIHAQKQSLPDPKSQGLFDSLKEWSMANKKIVALLIIVILAFGAKAGWNSLLQIGIYEGYEPEQPIAFSHKIHAGTQKIDCNYCHSSARHSKTSGIPSANVCMNCHTYIQEGATTGTEEIAKIYAALDYDPTLKTYGDNPKPIKWIKVHNLPDHVFFSHQQHVTVGEIKCQKCHGPVEEMDVVQQHAPLTMGWCIECHRETNVKMEGNPYYDDIHERLPENFVKKFMEDGRITVDELGGIECSKCHY